MKTQILKVKICSSRLPDWGLSLTRSLSSLGRIEWDTEIRILGTGVGHLSRKQ